MASTGLHLSIDDWLQKIDLYIYKSLFTKYNGVEDILWMTERDLKNIGINNGGHRARISSSLGILKDKYEKTFKVKENFNPEENAIHTDSIHKPYKSMSPVLCLNSEKCPGVRSWPSSGHSSMHSTKTSSPVSCNENYAGTNASVEELKCALEKELSLDSSDLRSYAWYHGTILRQRAENLLLQDGDFLVRDCISQPGDFVITCKWEDIPLHFIVKKIVLQPNTVYERMQYYFESNSFDSIPDFIRYYVGSKCPLSINSGAIISHPINRTMPLSYYASRYGIQCQIHYAAKALEKLPPVSRSCENSPNKGTLSLDNAPNIEVTQSNEPNKNFFEGENIQTVLPRKEIKNIKMNHSLMRVGSDPMLSPNTERRILENRPNSVSFSSNVIDSLKTESTVNGKAPPPKPSRVPSKKCTQKPLVIKRDRKTSVDEEAVEESQNGVPIQGVSLAHCFKRQISETRFSFLDRPSISDDGSLSEGDLSIFTVPELNPPSAFQPKTFKTSLLNEENAPLEGSVLSKAKEMLLAAPSKIIACHLTRMDLKIAKNVHDANLGACVTNGLELLLLPQGDQLRMDLLERTETMKLFICMLILTTAEEEERVKLLNKWIDIAIETKTSCGNFYGFTSIMLALTLPEVAELQSTWLALRHFYTDTAFVFETKLKPEFKELQNASDLEAPSICIPYLLSLIIILQKHGAVMNFIDQHPLDNEEISKNVLDFNLFGTQVTNDYGLQLLADHLELGRNIMKQYPIFKKNCEVFLQPFKYDVSMLDLFRTEFQLRILWGYRGCVVCPQERYHKFKKVLNFFHNKCNETAS